MRGLATKLWTSPMFTTWGAYLARSLHFFLLTPFILKIFPNEDVSLWFLFGFIINMQNMFDLGLGVTFVRLISYGYGGASKIPDVDRNTPLKGKEKSKNFSSRPNWNFVGELYSTMRVFYLALTFGFFLILAIGGTLLLEKPIEHLFINDQSFIEQREIGNDVNSFTEGLVSISDQDINVVVLSEVDNLKTLEALLEMAESGRLVLVIMNYDTVISCIQGIVSDFPEAKKKWVRDVLAKYLVGIIAQKLIPDVKGDQALAVEILTSSDSGKSLIKDGRFANLESIIQTSRAQGMISMDMSLAELVRMGRIDQQEAAKYATDPKTIAKLFR